VLVMLANAGRSAGAAGTSPEALQGLVNAQYGAALFALLGVGVALWLRPEKSGVHPSADPDPQPFAGNA
jgi:hypothetical protein